MEACREDRAVKGAEGPDSQATPAGPDVGRGDIPLQFVKMTRMTEVVGRLEPGPMSQAELPLMNRVS